MRFLMIAGAATFLLMPASAPASAGDAKHSARAVSTEYSAAATKKVVKKKKEKVEYMRSAAGPEPKKK